LKLGNPGKRRKAENREIVKSRNWETLGKGGRRNTWKLGNLEIGKRGAKILKPGSLETRSLGRRETLRKIRDTVGGRGRKKSEIKDRNSEMPAGRARYP